MPRAWLTRSNPEATTLFLKLQTQPVQAVPLQLPATGASWSETSLRVTLMSFLVYVQKVSKPPKSILPLFASEMIVAMMDSALVAFNSLDWPATVTILGELNLSTMDLPILPSPSLNREF